MSHRRREEDSWPSFNEIAEAAASGTGKGVRIAVIDSGIEASHPRLADLSIRDAVRFEEKGGSIEVIEDDGSDGFGHGTAVADIIHRFAPEAEIGSFRVIDARSLSRTHLICAGVREAIRRGYHVLNCSFGCRGMAKFILPHKEWADEAWLKGIHVVAACSNSGNDEAEWPSHFASVIGVDLADTPGDEIFYRGDHLVSFSAKGENVEVAWLNGSIQVQTGTSFTAPKISAHIARILSVYPGTPPSTMYSLLASVAEPWHPGLSPDW
ncbi:MAG: S8 family serine peptidase [Verrucomicrobiales bacterium]|nr:S8 family serine peptidase [Verrucomicrobiales bacterium]